MATKQNSRKRPLRASGRPTLAWKRRFLKVLAARPVVLYACKLAGISQVSAYRHRNEDPEFRRRWDEALEAGWSKILVTAHKVAAEGVKHGVWKTVAGKVKKVEVVTEFSAPMMQFMLKSKFPEFRDQQTVRHVGDDEAPPIRTVNQELPPLLPKDLEDGV